MQNPASYCDGIVKHLTNRDKSANVLESDDSQYNKRTAVTVLFRSVDVSFEFYDLRDLTDWTASVDDRWQSVE